MQPVRKTSPEGVAYRDAPIARPGGHRASVARAQLAQHQALGDEVGRPNRGRQTRSDHEAKRIVRDMFRQDFPKDARPPAPCL